VNPFFLPNSIPLFSSRWRDGVGSGGGVAQFSTCDTGHALTLCLPRPPSPTVLGICINLSSFFLRLWCLSGVLPAEFSELLDPRRLLGDLTSVCPGIPAGRTGLTVPYSHSYAFESGNFPSGCRTRFRNPHHCGGINLFNTGGYGPWHVFPLFLVLFALPSHRMHNSCFPLL